MVESGDVLLKGGGLWKRLKTLRFDSVRKQEFRDCIYSDLSEGWVDALRCFRAEKDNSCLPLGSSIGKSDMLVPAIVKIV